MYTVHVDSGDWLIVADIAVSSGLFRGIAVYSPNEQSNVSTASVDSSRLMLMGDWKTFLNPKIDRRRGTSVRSSEDHSLIDMIGEFDRYRVDHPGREMWMWTLKWPSLRVSQ